MKRSASFVISALIASAQGCGDSQPSTPTLDAGGEPDAIPLPETKCTLEGDYQSVRMPAEDGAELQTYYWIPTCDDGRTRHPALLFRTPYCDDTLSCAVDYQAVYARRFAERGYAFIFQESRGTARSSGTFHPFSDEFRDGKTAAEWIHAQEWFDGKLGTIGPSYAGFTALATAAAAGDLVSAVVADGAPGDLYRGWFREQGGVINSDLIDWLYLIEHGDWPPEPFYIAFTNVAPLADADVVLLGHDDPLWNAYIDAYGDPTRPFWQEASLAPRFRDLCVPILHIKANEEIWTGPTLNYEGIAREGCGGAGNPDQWFIFGTEQHGGLTNGSDSEVSQPAFNLMYDFLDRYLKGIDAALPANKLLVRFERTTTWQAKASWPPADAIELQLYLRNVSDNTMGMLETTTGDYPIATYASSPIHDDICGSGSEQLVYITDPLPSPLDIFGNPRVRLWIRTNVVDADFFALLLSENATLSNYRLMTMGYQRLSFRGPDGQSSGPAEPNTIQEVEIEMFPLAYEIEAGRILTLVVTSSMCGRNVNHHTGGPLSTDTTFADATIEVFADTAHPSALVLPITAN